MDIKKDVLDVLKECTFDGNKLFLPKRQLDRKLYVSVDSVLKSLGGIWNRKSKAHIFESSSAEEALNNVIKSEKFVDPKKDECFFETPDSLAEYLVKLAVLSDTKMLVLEPSAGKGNIALKIPKIHNIHVCETNSGRQEILKDNGFELVGSDFLQYNPGPIYDRIIANPPFSKNAGYDHFEHMLNLVKKGGRIVCVLSSAIFNSTNKRVSRIRDQVLESGTIIPLEDGSFKQSGTLVKSCVVVYNKP